MNKEHTLLIDCKLSFADGALERLLRVIRVRGFQLRMLSCETHDQHYRLSLTLAGSREPLNLMAQLSKIPDVFNLALTKIEEVESALDTPLEVAV